MTAVETLFKKIEKFNTAREYQKIIDLLKDEVLEEHKSPELFEKRFWAHLLLGQPKEALRYANKAIELEPAFYFGFYLRGLAYTDMGDLKFAIADFDKTIELKSDFADVYNDRGIAFYRLGDNGKAIESFSKAIELDSKFENAYLNRAQVLKNKGEFNKALADYDQIIAINPTAPSFITRGQAYEYNGELTKALADYEQAVKLVPGNAYYYTFRGQVLEKAGEFEKAMADFNKAVELEPTDPYYYNFRGLAWDSSGDFDKALKDYDTAVKLDPADPGSFINRGYVLIKKGEYNKGIAEYETAKNLNPENPEVYSLIGEVMITLKEYEKAITNLNKAIELNNDNFVYYGLRGDCYFLRGDYAKDENKKDDFEKALENYEKALELNEGLDLEPYISIVREKIDENKLLNSLEKGEPTNATEIHIERKRAFEKQIEEQIEIIKNEAKSDVKKVAHYTKLFAAKIFVTPTEANELTKFRYYNAIYMNDPMEGRIFFEYLNDPDIERAYQNGEKRAETSVYLGSFLPTTFINTKTDDEGFVKKGTHDELVMWRTYGKDSDGKEAAGCSIVLSSDFFGTQAAGKNDRSTSNLNDEELLNILYVENTGEVKKISNSIIGEKIEQATSKLKKIVQDFMAMGKEVGENDKFYKLIEVSIFKRLSRINFLFKSSDYQFENEVRVIRYIPRGSEKVMPQITEQQPGKKFYIESNNPILPFIERIYLGPKVENHQHWSFYFDWEIRQRAKELDLKNEKALLEKINADSGDMKNVNTITENKDNKKERMQEKKEYNLPDIKPSEIQVRKSERRFQ
jgi:tetratricopeptide (TPR) repeat protein